MEDRIKTSHDYIMESMAKELESVSASLANAAEALGRLTRYYSNLKCCIAQEDEQRRGEYDAGYEHGLRDRIRGTDDIPRSPDVAQRVSVGAEKRAKAKPLAGQVEPEDGENITLKDVVREILARSRYDISPDYIQFRTVDDGNGVKVIEFRLGVKHSCQGAIECRVIERFTVYLHSDLNNTVEEFDRAVGNFHMVRVPLKSDDHGDWDSLN